MDPQRDYVDEMDVGESLVGAYLRQIEGCQLVTYNQFLADTQGEIDVIGFSRSDGDVWLCEVTTHIGGFLLHGGSEGNTKTIAKKLDTMRKFAEEAFPDATITYQWWSPYVAKGWLTDLMHAAAVCRIL